MTTLICPICRSKQVTVVAQDRKGFSIGKAVGGTLLTGGIRAIAGFAGKKGKFQCQCLNCGKLFMISKHSFK